MAALYESYLVVAPIRTVNLSDKPKGIESYGIRTLLGDVRAVIREIALPATAGAREAASVPSTTKVTVRAAAKEFRMQVHS